MAYGIPTNLPYGVGTSSVTANLADYYTVASAASLTLTAAQVVGNSASVDLSITGSTTITTFTTPTAKNIVAALSSGNFVPLVGTSWRLRIINTSGATTSALTGGTGVTMAAFSSGAQTIANNAWREWVVSVTAVGSTPTVSFQSVATGTWS